MRRTSSVQEIYFRGKYTPHTPIVTVHLSFIFHCTQHIHVHVRMQPKRTAVIDYTIIRVYFT